MWNIVCLLICLCLVFLTDKAYTQPNTKCDGGIIEIPLDRVKNQYKNRVINMDTVTVLTRMMSKRKLPEPPEPPEPDPPNPKLKNLHCVYGEEMN